MKALSHSDAYQVLLLQAADEGRGSMLFGESVERAHPLVGDPFLDVTVLYGQAERGTRISSPVAGDHGEMLDWFSEAVKQHNDITCGFELDTKEDVVPTAAIHFQPRAHIELVQPFCEIVGEPERAGLYLDLAARMPQSWPLSFFGMFRGRPGSPLRVCGYLADAEKLACAQDPGHLVPVFDSIGFHAYNDAMLEQVSALMAAAVHIGFPILPVPAPLLYSL